ncbi:hypothetical protein ACFO1B_06470 [Dactylosporangium siamense]|uniref:Uncharacterized protein n=1 Tax=Dactylosporangium siamense TaxID=685454 RepID=A0A919PHN3_9ACTN|nr:hypothetical protein [Dactylosporangium siamense]GIG43401.1 hypothetical protein Dsi01nite_014420 [Dactylosporangium siamense]
MEYPDVFVNLRSAVLRGSRSYHRLEHLGRNRDSEADSPGRGYTLAEETITDLLIADMAGVAYEVAGPCPDCLPESADCAHWNGVAKSSEARLLIRPLTKAEEGGNRKKKAVGADFAMTFHNSTATGGAPGVRLLIQAKRAVLPVGRILTTPAEDRQFRQLITSADEYGAVPYYALYVQHPDAHRVSETRCPYTSESAADTAIVLAPAHPDRGLLNSRAEDAIAVGRPLLCMTGCPCCGTRTTAVTFDAALAFVHQDFPGYQPQEDLRPLPAGQAAVSIDDGRAAVVEAPNRSPRRGGAAGDDRKILIVRLGTTRESPDGRWIGYSPDMNPQQVKDSASKGWILDERKVAAVRHVVATFRDDVVGIYQISPNGPVKERVSGNRWIWNLRLQDFTDADLAEELRERARSRVRGLTPGTRSPVIYA